MKKEIKEKKERDWDMILTVGSLAILGVGVGSIAISYGIAMKESTKEISDLATENALCTIERGLRFANRRGILKFFDPDSGFEVDYDTADKILAKYAKELKESAK